MKAEWPKGGHGTLAHSLEALSLLETRIEELKQGARENHEAWGERHRKETADLRILLARETKWRNDATDDVARLSAQRDEAVSLNVRYREALEEIASDTHVWDIDGWAQRLARTVLSPEGTE
jgi:nicotinamide riboside kinase